MENAEIRKFTFDSPDGNCTITGYEKDGILHTACIGRLDVYGAIFLTDLVDKICKRTGQKVLQLLDASKLVADTPEGRKVLGQAWMRKDSPLEKLALFGGAFFMNSLIKLYGRITAFPMKAVETEEEALRWLGPGS